MPAAESVFRQEFPVKGGDFAKAGDRACADQGAPEGPRARHRDRAPGGHRRLRSGDERHHVRLARAAWTWPSLPQEVRITVDDRGPGIADVELAMTEGYSTATAEMRELGFGAGMGLPNIKRNADVFAIDSAVGPGDPPRRSSSGRTDT